MFSVLIFPIVGLKAFRVGGILRLIRATSRNPLSAPASARIDVLSMCLPLMMESPIRKASVPVVPQPFLQPLENSLEFCANVSGVARLRPLALYFRWLPISTFLNCTGSWPNHSKRLR